MKRHEDASIEHQLMVITLANQSCKNEKLFPNYHKFIKHTLMDLLPFYCLCTANTILLAIVLANLDLHLNIWDKAFLHTKDPSYGQYA